MYMCKSKVLLTKKKAIFSLCAWLLSVVLLAIFVFAGGNTALLVLSGVLLLSRAKVCAAYAEAFRRSVVNPHKELCFVCYLALPVAEITFLLRGCEEIAIRPFWMRIPLHSNIAIAEAIMEVSPYVAAAEDHNSAITIDNTPVGKVTVTINRARQELYIFLLSGECTIAENVILPEPWKKERFAQEYADEYSIECELNYCPYGTISELVALILYQLNRLVFAAGKGE